MQLSLFDQPVVHPGGAFTNDYHLLPVSEKQLSYARQIAARMRAKLPDEVQTDRRKLSRWIDDNRNVGASGRYASYPSSKQVAFAERIARIKRRNVPQECFRDKGMMSRWIDSNR